MRQSSNELVWLETDYELFAKEGAEGVQVEKLARIPGLNKSDFYRYFWTEFLDLPQCPGLAMRYFVFIRATFYARLSLENFIHDSCVNLSPRQKYSCIN